MGGGKTCLQMLQLDIGRQGLILLSASLAKRHQTRRSGRVVCLNTWQSWGLNRGVWAKAWFAGVPLGLAGFLERFGLGIGMLLVKCLPTLCLEKCRCCSPEIVVEISLWKSVFDMYSYIHR